MDHDESNAFPPAIARRQGGFVYFDVPESGVCNRPLIACS
jgi:hypothetical protein